MKNTNIFLLHGGSTAFSHANNFPFWREVGTANDKKEQKMLLIPFAMSSQYQDNTPYELATIRERIEYANPHIKISASLARESKKFFKEQLKEADIIFVSGGDGDLLQERIADLISPAEFRTLMSENTGKVISGASAGTNMWSKYYYSNDNQAVMEGFGVLPIKSFCHYNSMKWRNLNKLIAHKENMPVIPIGDFEYIKVEKTR